MWWALAFFVVGFILTAFISPKMKVENAKAAGLDEFNFPRADEGDPVPRFYGTVKLPSPNTVAQAGFKSVPIKKKVKTGLFSSKKVVTGYKYYLGLQLVWGLGPDVVYRKIWFGDDLIWTGCLGSNYFNNDGVYFEDINLPELYGGSDDGNRGGISGRIYMYAGRHTQPRNAWLVANVDADVPAYRGVAYMVFQDFWWGNQPQIDNVACEAQYLPDGLGLAPECKHIMSNGLDSNAICVLYDIFTTEWGNLGFSTNKIDYAGWKAVAEQIWEEQNGVSLIISSQTTGVDVAKTILSQIDGLIYEDMTAGVVRLKLLRNDYDINTIPEFGVEDIVSIKSYSKKLWNETNNVVRIKYQDRDDNYKSDKIAIARDSSLLRFQGKERPTELEMPGVKVASLANRIGASKLSNLNVPLYQAEMVGNRRMSTLAPGDVFKWKWPEYGVQQMVLRVRKMGLGSYEDGQLTISVVQDEFALDSVVTSDPAPTGYTPEIITPSKILVEVVFELPNFLLQNALYTPTAEQTHVAIFAKAPSGYSIGYDAYVEAGTEDPQILTAEPYTNTATLNMAIERFDGFTNGSLTEVHVAGVTTLSDLQNSEDPRAAGNLFMIGNELFTFTTATQGIDDVVLSGVKRAFLDTGWEAHAVGAVVWFFDGAAGFNDDVTPVGSTTEFYATDKTPAGTSSASGATRVPVTPVGRYQLPVAPDYVTLDGIRDATHVFGTGEELTVAARARTRLETTTAWYETDAAATPEDGTTYQISVEIDGVETEVADDVSLPYNLATTGYVGDVVLLVRAKRDGLYSYSAAPYPMRFEDLLIVDDSVVTVDGEGIDFS